MTDDYEARLKEAFPDATVTAGSNGRMWVSVAPEGLLAAVGTLRERFSIRQLAVIVGEDLRDALQANYVFTGDRVIILQVRIDREKGEVPSLAAVIPGAMVYERELKDLLGIIAVGNPDLRRQAVPEDWPEGLYPLRKDVQLDRSDVAAAQEGI